MAVTYRVVDDFRPGMPQTKLGQVGPFRMIALHDTEGGVGDVGSLGTLYFLINTANERNASYHELWGWDEAKRLFTVRRIVPPTSAAHSVNPTPPPGGSYEPDALVREALGDRWQDPNRVIYAVSIAGKVADVERWSTDYEFVACCARRITELKKDLVPSGMMGEHFRINPSTRKDWGKSLTKKLQNGMPMLTNFAIERITIDKNARIRTEPSTSSSSSFLTSSDTFSVVTRIGTIDNSEGEWSVYWVTGWKAWGYTLKQNVLKVEPFSPEDLKDELAAAQALIGEKNVALDTVAAKATDLAASVKLARDL